jgi:DNA-binding Xre family transcriptional regulator
MAIHWRLKTYIATRHGIYKAVTFQKIIVRKTGVLISIQNLCNYLEKKPKSIRLKTIEILCTALDCELGDFCEVKPLPSIKPGSAEAGARKLSYQNTPLSKRAVRDFPDPKAYS